MIATRFIGARPVRAVGAALLLVLACMLPAAAGGGAVPAPGAFVVPFDVDPALDPGVVTAGEALSRVTWNDDTPAFPGDRPGSLTADYTSDLPAGWIGWRLPEPVTEDEPFTAAAVFVIDPEGFVADPNGYFEVSWGLWNAGTCGLERTGNAADPAGDTFQLAEFDWFPNVSPWFGGPWLSPSLFGAADPENPLFAQYGSFANMTFGSVEAALPLGEPLLAVLEHRPAEGIMVVQVWTIPPEGDPVPVPGAVTVVPLGWLSRPEYTFDTIGITLWHDGWQWGETPALTGRVTYHLLAFRRGRLDVRRLPGLEPSGRED